MLEKLLQVAMSEYGVFVGFLLITNFILYKILRVLWNQNTFLANKMLDTIENNTRVVTQLVSKLEKHNV